MIREIFEHKAVKIGVIAAAVIIAIPLGVLFYALQYPYHLSITNINCGEMRIPMYKVAGIALVKTVSGKNPIMPGQEATFSIPNLLLDTRVVIDGSQSNKIAMKASFGDIYTSDTSTIDSSRIASLTIEGYEIMGTPPTTFEIDNTTRITVVCLEGSDPNLAPI